MQFWELQAWMNIMILTEASDAPDAESLLSRKAVLQFLRSLGVCLLCHYNLLCCTILESFSIPSCTTAVGSSTETLPPGLIASCVFQFTALLHKEIGKQANQIVQLCYQYRITNCSALHALSSGALEGGSYSWVSVIVLVYMEHILGGGTVLSWAWIITQLWDGVGWNTRVVWPNWQWPSPPTHIAGGNW